MMIRQLRPRSIAQGFSLMELMVGLAVGLVVVMAGAMVYASNQASSEAISEQNKMEETTRYLAKLSLSNFGAAGFFGCQSRSGIIQNNINNPTSFLYNFSQPVFAYEGSASGVLNGPLPASLSGASPAPPSKAASDILVIRSAVGDPLPVDASAPATKPAPGASGSIWVDAGAAIGSLPSNSLAMITNCSKATAFVHTGKACSTLAGCELLHASGAAPSPGNSTSSLGFNYDFDAEVVIPATTSYYVAESGRCAAQAGSGCPSRSLYRMVGSNAPEELAENVQAMKITLLLDDGSGLGSASQARSPNGVSNWSNVVGIKADFLITSSKPILPESRSTSFGGSVFSDKLARRVVSTIAPLRNAMP